MAGPALVYQFDPTRPESRSARSDADDALQRAAGRRDLLQPQQAFVHEQGARYIDFLLPVGELPRATMELAYGATMLGGHTSLIEAAEKIATAVRALVPAPAEIASLPAPRLLPKVPFRFCVHDDGDLHWMQLEGGTGELAPSAVRVLDLDDNVIETRKCIPLAPGQKGHARLPEGESAGVAWVVIGVSSDVVAAFDAGGAGPIRFEARVGEEWLSAQLSDTGCRIGRQALKVAVS